MTFAPDAAGFVRVVVVDDSPFVCRLLTAYLESAPQIQVVGAAFNGPYAGRLVEQLRPNVVTLDLDMPGMNGLETLAQIMRRYPVPVVVVSGLNRGAALTTLEAISLGAVDFVLKYTPGEDTNPETLRREVIAKVLAAARIKVVRSIPAKNYQPDSAGQPPEDSPLSGVTVEANGSMLSQKSRKDETGAGSADWVVVIGASTGGPVAIRQLLSCLPANFPAAMIVVQHIPANFTRVLAAQLNGQSPIRVKEAVAGDLLAPGMVLIAPGDYHLLAQLEDKVTLNQKPEVNGHRPSIDVTMQSIAHQYGSRAIGVVLTGMGNDGVQGLLSIRGQGGRTYAQSAATCVVDGMPQRAIERGAVEQVGSPTEIARFLRDVVCRERQ
jgi:two-component system chemotaxis response regulator CheB